MRAAKLWVFSLYVLAAVVMLTLGGFGLVRLAPSASASDAPVAPCPSWPLPLPSQDSAYESKLYQYVNNFCYQKDPKWKGDAAYRDTGFFIGGNKLGVHNSVRVYYSPEMYAWMQAGEPEGKIPEGATIIKEMYPMPAVQTYTNANITGLAIMVRDSKVAWDGWYWSDGGQSISYTYNYPSSGYGLYCINCHASTAKTDLTFSVLRNITGDPLVFNPTMPPNLIPSPSPSPSAAAAAVISETVVSAVTQQQGEENAIQQEKKSGLSVHERRDSRPDAETNLQKPKPLRTLVHSALNLPDAPKQMQMEYFDNVTQGPRPNGQRGFLTSNQCIGCHDATQNNSTQPNMVYPQIYNESGTQTEIDLNVSPYSEWRASMMGLSGRDPIFFAQVETELNLHPEQTDNIVNTCLSCHGVMGQRQITEDNMGPFKLSYLDLVPPNPPFSNPLTVAQKYGKYGALARDGVSCTVCHRIAPEGLGHAQTYTGKFKVGKPDEIYGPYTDVITLPMKNSLGLTPQSTTANQIRSSALCGSCHTVTLPILKVGQRYPGNPFTDPAIPTEHEQLTYLEWRNSKYQNEQPPINQSSVQTCQDCHMPDRYPSKTGNKLQFKVASIEEDIFAAVDNRAKDDDIHLKVRGEDPKEAPYSRHTLLGMNIFALEIFNQFSNTLGLVSSDPMATWGNAPNGLTLAKKSALDLARNETAQVKVLSAKRTSEGLTAQVKLTNLAGHKFPSGVSFRRAFIEFRVDIEGVTYWVSGATNHDGVIGTYDGVEFTPLVTEFFDLKTNPQQQYQPHYETIDSQDKVQIYEELMQDSDFHFTTSFLSLDHEIKDNRLMPQGWKPGLMVPDPDPNSPPGKKVPDPTHPGKGVINDPRTHPNSAGYFNGTGSDIVTYNVPLKNISSKAQIAVSATLFYQTIPPYYLQQRFMGAPDGAFTRSLIYYVRNLDVNYIDPDWSLLLGEAPIKNWKLMITADTATLR